MVREYDYLNQYYCPTPSACVRTKTNMPSGFVGPASSFQECYDPSTGNTSEVRTWNPVYDYGSQPPSGNRAEQCASVTPVVVVPVGKGGQSDCSWVWWFVFLMILAGVLLLVLLASYKREPSAGKGKTLSSSATSTSAEKALLMKPQVPRT